MVTGASGMSAGTLFAPTPEERLAALEAFVVTERGHRAGMLARHPENAAYWEGRVRDAEAALAHVAALRAEIAAPQKKSSREVWGSGSVATTNGA